MTHIWIVKNESELKHLPTNKKLKMISIQRNPIYEIEASILSKDLCDYINTKNKIAVTSFNMSLINTIAVIEGLLIKCKEFPDITYHTNPSKTMFDGWEEDKAS